MRRVPPTLALLGTVLDLTTVRGEQRTLWEGSDVGGMLLCGDARAMDKGPGRAALWLLRGRTANGGAVPDGEVLIEYWAKPTEWGEGYWGAVVRNVGLGSERFDYPRKGFETTADATGEQLALAYARQLAEQEAAHYSGDWKITIRERRTGNAEKLRAERVHIDRQGYANRGRDYFGVGGLPLFRVYTVDSGEFDEYVRAPSAKEAKAHARAELAKRREREARTGNPTRADAGDTYAAWHKREPTQCTELDGLPESLPHYIGRATRIGYRSDKWHAAGATEDYDHDYTEPGYECPGVWADAPDLANARAIVIRGGNQRITPGGID